MTPQQDGRGFRRKLALKNMASQPRVSIAFTALFASALPLLMCGCAKHFAVATMGNARRAIAKEQYDEALEYLDYSDMYAQDDADLQSKIARLRGECLEAQGRMDDASGVYQHLAATYPDTAEAAQAKLRVAKLPAADGSVEAEAASKLR